MARRKPFDEYRSTTKSERIAERNKLKAMQKTEKFDTWLIKTIVYFQRNECYYCDNAVSYADRESYHIDHRVPIYYGGKSDYYNLCISCPACNIAKGTQQLVRNKAFLKRDRVREPIYYL